MVFEEGIRIKRDTLEYVIEMLRRTHEYEEGEEYMKMLKLIVTKIKPKYLLHKAANVIIVSPTTFSAYLQSVLYGFRAFKIEESAKQIGKQVEALSRHMRSYDEYFKKLGNSLGTTVNHYNSAQ